MVWFFFRQAAQQNAASPNNVFFSSAMCPFLLFLSLSLEEVLVVSVVATPLGWLPSAVVFPNSLVEDSPQQDGMLPISPSPPTTE